MGGRGKNPEDKSKQIDLRHIILQSRIGDIGRTGELLRSRRRGLQGSEGGSGAPVHGDTLANTKKCACCLHRSLPAKTHYTTCPICGWIDDPLQNVNPDLAKGRNPISLREAQRRWQERQAG